ncbi:chymotrypsin inhibitor-like isoform X2 [Tachypleus tridentatus]|uniref:chymotrypsin inhibitor-like isoform X2 n=1 Tax=Tachypleus tridentatus TaxID=6853 RepID=UPI003FD2D353
MKSFSTFLSIVIVMFVAHGHSAHLKHEKLCARPNEIYLSCGSACGIYTCADVLRNRLQQQIFCTQQCITGCFCKNELVRGPNGNCIPKHACPTSG